MRRLCMRKIIVCDICNTLLDSRHRQCADTFFFSLIHQDLLNYPVAQTLKAMQKQGSRLVFFAFSNARYKSVVHQVLHKYGFDKDEYDLYVDCNSPAVYDACTLKKHVYDNTLKDDDIVYAIDRDMKSIE